MTDCDSLRDCLLAGRKPNSALEQHARECEICAELLGSDGQLGRIMAMRGEGSSVTPPAASTLFSGLQLQLEQERGIRAFLRSRPTWLRIAVVLAALMGIAGLHLGGLLRADVGVYPGDRLALELALLGLVGILSVRLGLRPQFKPGASVAWGVGVALSAALLPVISIMMGPAHQHHAASLAGLGDALLARAAGCFLYGAIFATPVVVMAWLLDRGPARSAALAFAAAATVGANLALWLHCPITHGAHIALGHVPVGICLLGAALLLRRGRQRLD